jgi:hypothetical protein
MCHHCDWWKRSDRPHETFLWGWKQYEWDIDMAKEIVADGREVYSCPIERLKSAVDYPVVPGQFSLIGVGVLEEHLDHVDPTMPIILGRIPGQTGVLPFDGHHRIARCIRDNIPEIPCVILTEEESERCNLRRPYIPKPEPTKRKKRGKRSRTAN